MKYKIGFISHNSNTIHRFPELGEQVGCKIIWHPCIDEPAIDVATKLAEQHRVDAIICSPVTYKFIHNLINVPVIPLFLENFTLLKSIYRSQQYGKNIAFMQFYNSEAAYDLNFICKILNCTVTGFMIKKSEEIIPTIAQLKNKYDVLISTFDNIVNIANDYGLLGQLIEIQKSEYLNTINHAIIMLNSSNRYLAYTRFREAILNVSNDGIVGLDADGNIDFVNQVALNYLNLSNQEIKNKCNSALVKLNPLLKKILSAGNKLEMISDGDSKILIERKNIFDESGKYIGSVIRLTNVEILQKREMKARGMINKSGFIAQNVFEDIKGKSRILVDCINTAKRYATSMSNILITGESGTGKEMFAQSLHNYSHQKNGPFLAINCATFPENLLESELFGHEEGAFTGAIKGGRLGLFELSDSGTLFLDEICEMPYPLQSRLLRVLEEHSIRRVGGNKNISINVRIISATNKNLICEVKEKKFREDLYYRLNVLNLKIPALREMREDIPVLVEDLLRKTCMKESKGLKFNNKFFDYLEQYPWPGNIRELRNFIEKLIVISDGKQVSLQLIKKMLNDTFNQRYDEYENFNNEEKLIISIGTLKEIEKEVIMKMYNKYNGNQEKLHNVLGISRATIWRHLKNNSFKNN